MFEVFDGNSFSHRFFKLLALNRYLRVRFCDIYQSTTLVTFSLTYTMFEVSFGFLMVIVSAKVSEIITLEEIFSKPFQRYIILFCRSNIG